jgi:hypothetical protein
VLAIGTAERITLKIQFEHLIAAIAANCSLLERLEFRWDRDEIRKERPTYFIAFEIYHFKRIVRRRLIFRPNHAFTIRQKTRHARPDQSVARQYQNSGLCTDCTRRVLSNPAER